MASSVHELLNTISELLHHRVAHDHAVPHTSIPALCLLLGTVTGKICAEMQSHDSSHLVVFSFKLRKTSAHIDDPEFELFQVWVNMSTQVQSQLSGRCVYSHLRTPNSPPDHSHSCCEELFFLALYAHVIQSH